MQYLKKIYNNKKNIISSNILVDEYFMTLTFFEFKNIYEIAIFMYCRYKIILPPATSLFSMQKEIYIL